MPTSKGSKLAIRRRAVVLPAPLGPVRKIISSGFTSKDKSDKTGVEL